MNIWRGKVGICKQLHMSHHGMMAPVLLCRCSDECCMLSIATEEGLVGWHLLAHEPSPAWGRSTPSCIVHGDRICAVHSQARSHTSVHQSSRRIYSFLLSFHLQCSDVRSLHETFKSACRRL